MTDPQKDEGATKDPFKEDPHGKCMGRYKHYFSWVWENGQMTNRVKCNTCGKVETRDKAGVDR